MAVFQYRGVDKSGRAVAGTMTAEDAINLEEKLRASGYWLLDAKAREQGPAKKSGPGQASWISWGTGVKRRDLIEFCTMMDFQSRAGVPLVQALKVGSVHRINAVNIRIDRILQNFTSSF